MKAHMIAPCGLNCTLCGRHLHDNPPCPGCSGPDELKPDCCRVRCAIVRCAFRKDIPGGFCDGCGNYPCQDIMEKEIRYTSAYPMIEAPMANLAFIRQNGMEAFLEQEEKRWTCPSCGGVICIHDGMCARCKAKYTHRTAVKA